MSDRVKGACLTMGGAACWGVSGCMGQYLFTRENMDSTWLVPIRLFLAGLILCTFYFIRAQDVLRPVEREEKSPQPAGSAHLRPGGRKLLPVHLLFDHPAFQRGHGHHFAGPLPPSSSCWWSASSSTAGRVCLKFAAFCWPSSACFCLPLTAA